MGKRFENTLKEKRIARLKSFEFWFENVMFSGWHIMFATLFLELIGLPLCDMWYVAVIIGLSLGIRQAMRSIDEKIYIETINSLQDEIDMNAGWQLTFRDGYYISDYMTYDGKYVARTVSKEIEPHDRYILYINEKDNFDSSWEDPMVKEYFSTEHELKKYMRCWVDWVD